MLDSTGPGDRVVINIAEEALDDLSYRLGRTRWPDEIPESGWSYGTNKAYLKSLVKFWQQDWQWREAEAWLNSFPHFKTDMDGLGLHYVHVESTDADAIPILLLHGWPSTFIQMLQLIPLLTDPQSHGAEGPAFHVVAVSLPGFGFSDSPDAPGMHMERIAELMSQLMTDHLGYKRYAARGSDLGGTVIDQIARNRPEELLGIHMTGIIVAGAALSPDDVTCAEQRFLDASASMANTEIAYARMHMSKPQTVAYALNDSPAGLAAWIVEKYHSWGDTGGNVESRFSKNFLLTTLSTFWFAQNINASMRTYYEMVRNRGSTAYIDVPTAMLMSHRDLFPAAPREWAERSYNIVQWNETETGGHFLEWEEPVLVARDIHTFFQHLRG